MKNNKCCDPTAPNKNCSVCGNIVYTCERESTENNDYRCTKHKNGIEDNNGNWFCVEVCYDSIHENKK